MRGWNDRNTRDGHQLTCGRTAIPRKEQGPLIDQLLPGSSTTLPAERRGPLAYLLRHMEGAGRVRTW